MITKKEKIIYFIVGIVCGTVGIGVLLWANRKILIGVYLLHIAAYAINQISANRKRTKIEKHYQNLIDKLQLKL